RIGGDEFVVVLEGVRQPDDVAAVADRILQSLGEPYRLGSVPVHVSVSIGIVTAEQAGDDALAVLRDGDTAMYEAKRAGRGRWVAFDPAMHERLRASMELEGDLRQALVSDQLYVVYQPVVDLGDEGLHGVEALVRWRHPERGEIGPGAFIPLAEECGLIDAIGDLVLHKACEQFARWQQRWGSRAPKVVAVNLSRAQLRQPGLVPEVQAVLEANGMRPEQLQLEVTESFAAQDPQMQAMLRALKAAGVRLALDDFGTGYSSLACLHLLPVDTVKIDRSFVAHARDVEYHRVLIGATIRVAWSLGMSTVAEGIETQDQADLMGELKCDRGQGYFFGRPMTAEALDRWIETESTGTVA
ncbi:MAG: bifunctional diguanylate cyclase/phosphodiesterase, partial [Rubrivivax sp.]|nr:bifunctional diguanylate cyclase/phosphodiesterase [Rubrivivax sp.]